MKTGYHEENRKAWLAGYSARCAGLTLTSCTQDPARKKAWRDGWKEKDEEEQPYRTVVVDPDTGLDQADMDCFVSGRVRAM